MFRLLNAILVIGLLVASYFVYDLEHATRSGEREITRLEARIKEERENYKLLTAEWSLLTRPDRIQYLAEKHLHLKVLAPEQVIGPGDLETRLPAAPAIRVDPHSADPIGDVLKKMEEAQQ
jgi:cell division protein FtsL